MHLTPEDCNPIKDIICKFSACQCNCPIKRNAFSLKVFVSGTKFLAAVMSETVELDESDLDANSALMICKLCKLNHVELLVYLSLKYCGKIYPKAIQLAE